MQGGDQTEWAAHRALEQAAGGARGVAMGELLTWRRLWKITGTAGFCGLEDESLPGEGVLEGVLWIVSI